MKRFLRVTGWSLLAVVVASSVIVGVRFGIAQAAVDRFDRTPTTRLESIGTVEHLTILPLFEKATSSTDLAMGHGVGYLVQTDAGTILVDVGFNPENLDPSPIEQNMAALGVTLDTIDTIFITHHHPDHTGGVTWWQQGTFSLGTTQVDLADKQILTPIALTYPGAKPEAAAAPRVLAPGIVALGAIPFVDVFPLSLVRPQMIEQVLAVNVADVGVILISGCGHPGLERMVETAEQVLGQPVAGIVGGLHYGEGVTPAVNAGIALLEEHDAALVALSPHDTGAAGLKAFATAFGAAYHQIAVGEAIVVR